MEKRKKGKPTGRHHRSASSGDENSGIGSSPPWWTGAGSRGQSGSPRWSTAVEWPAAGSAPRWWAAAVAGSTGWGPATSSSCWSPGTGASGPPSCSAGAACVAADYRPARESDPATDVSANHDVRHAMRCPATGSPVAMSAVHSPPPADPG